MWLNYTELDSVMSQSEDTSYKSLLVLPTSPCGYSYFFQVFQLGSSLPLPPPPRIN